MGLRKSWGSKGGVFIHGGNVPSVAVTFFKRNPLQSCILAYIANA